jgi:hypothetical protein
MAHRSRLIGAGAITLAAGVLIAMPTFSSGATVKNDLRSFAPAPRVAHDATQPALEPPLHGTDQHAQGTVGVVDLNPDNGRPFTSDPTGQGDNEDVVIGRSRAERRGDGTYHGHVTVAALFGNEIIPGADTGPGQTVTKDILQPLLDALCTGGATAGICLSAVHVESTTTTTGSTNSFRLLGATVGGVTGLPVTAGINVGVASSEASIGHSATCQVAHGASNVADVKVGAVTAKASTSATDSVACQNQAPVQTNSSQVIELGGAGIGLPLAGCANGTPDTDLNLVLLRVVCNADDSSATAPAAQRQADAPYGVRNALDVYVASLGASSLVQASTAQSESHAVAPAAVTTPTTTTTTPATTTPVTTTPAAVTTTPAAATTVPALSGSGTPTDTTGNEPTDNGNADNGGGDNGGGDTQCADGADNDGDGVIDAADPGCHSDGNANNPASYVPSDDSEANGGASISGKQLPFTGTDVVVLGLAGLLLLAAGLTLRGPARRRELES